MKRPNNFILSVLWGVLICLAFTSCENFLDGQNIKDQIIEEIEIANTNPVTFYVTADENTGTVTPTQLRLKKKETFEVLFSPSNNYIFQKWEVLDRSTGEPIEGVIKFKNETALETSGLVLVARENLMIHPKCLLQPAVVSHTPANAAEIQFANTPVEIHFNVPVDLNNVKDNMYIYSSSVNDLKSFFNFSLSEDGQTLTLLPLNPDFKEKITENTMDVTFSLSDKITVEQDETELSLIQNSQSTFKVCYKSVTENVKPHKNLFFLTRTAISLSNAETLDVSKRMSSSYTPASIHATSSNDEKNQVLRNTTSSKVYVYGNYYDEDSGVRKISIIEKRIKDVYNRSVTETEIPSTYILGEDYGNTVQFHTENGITKFCIEYNLHSANGAVQLSTVIYDAAANPSEETESVNVIKISADSYKETDSEGNGKPYISNLTDPLNIEFNESTYPTSSKNIYVGLIFGSGSMFPVIEKIYSGFDRDYNNITAYCQYRNRNGVIVAPPMTKGNGSINYSHTLDVANLNGLECNIILVDEELDNSTTISVKFPNAPDYAYKEGTQLKLISSNNYSYQLIKNISATETTISSSCTMEAGYDYRILPDNWTDQNDAYLRLLGDIGTQIYRSTDFGTLSTMVNLASTNGIVTEKSSQKEKTDITINLASDTWTTYDSVFINHYREGGVQYRKEFKRGENSLTFTEDTLMMYQYNYHIDIYGIKNNKVTQNARAITIDRFTDSSHDNIPPKATISRPLGNYYYLSVTDTGSSPESAYLITKNNEKIPVIEEGDTVFTNVQILAKTIEKQGKNEVADSHLYYYFELEDTAGNTSIYKVDAGSNSVNKGVSSISSASSGTWKLDFYENVKYIRIDKYYEDDGVYWYLNTSPIQETLNSAVYNKTYNIDNNIFIKVITAAADIVSRYSAPQYFYTGTKNTGNFDYMLPYSEKEKLIASDAPVLVETIATKRSFDECKNWSESDWVPDNDCKTVGRPVVFSLSSTVVGPAKYKIPFYFMDEDEIQAFYNDYYCYVVIARFADGTNVMSEVMKR